MKDRLRASDYRFIGVCLALLAATTWFSVRNFYRAFPEASIDFRVSRDDAQALAARFLTDQGYHTDAYRRASSFTFDDNAKTFLEREVGLEEANRIMGTRVRLWHWAYRWFRPQQKEEFRVELTTRGELAGFDHDIAEDAARPDVTGEQARALAENFLRSRLHRDPASLEFVEVSESARPHRVDRVYTWKERDFNLHDATNRLEVTVQGNEVAGYREYLKIPDQWQRDYERLRSKNTVASTVDSAVMIAMVVGLVIVIVMRVRRQDVRWRRAAIVGLIAMVLAFLSHLNQMPLQEFEYPTTDSYTSFMARQLLQGILAALGAGGLLFVLTAGAEPLYREAFGDKISLGSLFKMQGLRTKRFLLGSILGITLTGIFIAYQTGFYIVAYRFGAWSPADVPYSDLLNTRFPWLFVLFGGFLPAVSEEFLFRMFGITFLRKLVRSLAVAVVLAGFIWGFGHAAYPQQPFYIRGVEVGIGGVALGLIMLRWGILPTLVWHYSVDAMYSAMLLLRSQSLYFRLSGAAAAGIIVLPVAAALIAYWRKGGFEPETGLLNVDEAAPAEAPAEPEAAPASEGVQRQPLATRTKLAAAAVFAIGLLAFQIPVQRFGESPSFKTTDEQARASADAFVRTLKLDPNAFRHVTFPAVHWGGDDGLAGKYFLERRPVSAAAALFEQNRPVQHWVTRYFKSLDKEEVLVTVHPESLKVLGFHHSIPEDRPGADLSEDAARQIASSFASSQGWNTSAMDVKESHSEKQKARRDYTLVWEARPGDARNVDEAHFRLEVEVNGDQATALRSFWKIPEAYSRSRSEQNFISIAVTTLRFGVIAAGVVFGLWMLILNIRRGMVPWRTVIRIAVPTALLAGVGPLLSMKEMMQGYNTAIPLETFKAMLYVVVAMAVVFGFLIVGGAATLLSSFYPGSLALLRVENRRALARDAGIAAAAAVGIGLVVQKAGAFLMDRFHAFALFSIGSPDLLVSASPAAAAMANAIRSTLLLGAVLGMIALMIARVRKPWMVTVVLLLAASAELPLDIRTPGEFALQYAVELAAVAGAAAFCWWFARRNYLAYAVVLWVMALRGPLGELFGNPNSAYQRQGYMVAGLAAVVLVWVFLPAMRRASRVEAAASAG
jgi:membrane protease YdiL (CAAX protease family)